MATKLYVDKWAYATTEETLKNLFAEFGNVISTQLIMDRDSGQYKGFGFVEMEDYTGAQAAIKELNTKKFDVG